MQTVTSIAIAIYEKRIARLRQLAVEVHDDPTCPPHLREKILEGWNAAREAFCEECETAERDADRRRSASLINVGLSYLFTFVGLVAMFAVIEYAPLIGIVDEVYGAAAGILTLLCVAVPGIWFAMTRMSREFDATNSKET